MASTKESFSRVPYIGGPGTLLPRPVESFLSWMLAFSCLSVSGFHFLKTSILATSLYRLLSAKLWSPKNSTPQEDSSLQSFPCWLPLTTYSCGECSRETALMRYKQLVQMLQLDYKKRFGTDAFLEQISNDELVELIRTSQICRRLATLAMRPDKSKQSNAKHRQRGRSLTPSSRLPLGQRLIRLWPRLLELPRLDSCYPFAISLIIPCYRESGCQLHRRLTATLENCMHPNTIQVVIVDAGHCEGLDDFVSAMRKGSCFWGEVKMVKHEGGGGRGGCLNSGAKHATGQILTFCHADTRLPHNWDVTIQQQCKQSTTQRGDDNDDGRVIANSCAFQFGIDTSDVGLNGGPFPPGLRAIELTANIRTRLYALPYGDQCLSLPSAVFHYVGGYPHQSLMEDYELIDLLRKRSLLMPTLNPHARKERLAILGGKPVLCSPRRWQSFGVLYVTTMNSKIVNLYAGGLSADACYEIYYGRPPPPTVTDGLSPWEDDFRKAISNIDCEFKK